MIPINNSDLAWLIVSDYNQDHNVGFPNELREDIYNPDCNDWVYSYRLAGTGVGSHMHCWAGPVLLDTLDIEIHGVGVPLFFTGALQMGELHDGQYVGGMPYFVPSE